MDKTVRGNKHVCSECNTKFYDFNKEKIICPRCNNEITSKKETIAISRKLNIKDESKKIDNDISLEEDVEFGENAEDVINDEIDLGEDEANKDL